MKLIKLLVVMITFSLAAVTASAAIDVQDFVDYRSALIDTEEAGFVAGHQYALMFEIEAGNTTGYRVRYTDSTYNNFNDTAGDALNSLTAIARGTVAHQIPARFDSGTILSGNTGTITIFFTHGIDIPNIPADPEYLSFIGVYGIQGGEDYQTVGVLVSDLYGNVLAEYGTLEGAAPPASDEFREAVVTPPAVPVQQPADEPANEPIPENEPAASPPSDGDIPAEEENGTPPPAASPVPQSTANSGKTSPLLFLLIIFVAVIFGGATGGAIFLKKF
ncbi:MAG: hypothetical protein FWE74_08445 [Oscillospiraceae bacterium]|nr:hypothetical protein [Oscillospiraceae bacterium]